MRKTYFLLVLILIALLFIIFSVFPQIEIVETVNYLTEGPEGCATPLAGKNIVNESITLCKKTYLNSKIILTKNNLTIDCNGAILQGNKKGSGIDLNGYSNIVIKNCVIESYDAGIKFDYQAPGISGEVRESVNNTLINNVLRNNMINLYFSGYDVYDFPHDIDKSNTIDGKFVYVLRNVKNQVFDEKDKIGLFVCYSCDNVTIKNSKLSKNSIGIAFVDTNKSFIMNNTITYLDAQVTTTAGIFLSDSSNNYIEGNSISYCDAGIEIFGFPIEGVRIRDKTSTSLNNILQNNTVTFNGDGIILEYSMNTVLNDNIVCNSRGEHVGLIKDFDVDIACYEVQVPIEIGTWVTSTTGSGNKATNLDECDQLINTINC